MCRFVGELYKRSFLTKFIAYLCVTRLMDQIIKNEKSDIDELTVLCLCKFIETIGRKFDDDRSQAKDNTKNVPSNTLEVMLKALKNFVSQKQAGVPLRIQFEVQNLIELKEVTRRVFFLCIFVKCNQFQNKWVPRRVEAEPKTIKQVHSEAKLEAKIKKIELDSQSMRKQINYGGDQTVDSWD